MPESVYIHIPFCKSKCKYCSFVSVTSYDEDRYIKSLLKEINFYYGGEEVKTLYFGGGTPSLLSIKNIEKIADCFNINSSAEITLEMNPGDLDFNYLKSLKNMGINRLSIGSQTFNDNILKLIGRRHNSQDIINTVRAARKADFENISLDLIYGLPSQTISDVETDLNIITSLNVEHISTYGLKIEENSYFGKYLPENLPDDDLQADMYLLINKSLENSGFSRYEISNFARRGYVSNHNLNYWNNNDYYGFGLSAHGYKAGIRYCNASDIDRYYQNPTVHELEHTVSLKEKLEEEIFLGFRKSAGINVTGINKKFSIDFNKKYEQVLEKYIPCYIEQTNTGYRLTTSGVLLSNIILSDFL